ncbi:hypothetical protein PR001_g15744 [Phytophthora rubi]|uniref:Uncharacterized protein n=1 Tax=Phytophthora rubi TaxID=129364 RepID=A0A6A3KKI9_9STRA|nr:hypothetical protein PR002_g16225 [Phytophthora rubi]KAE9012102.1 hypothetical protein PR001_g15744 [Phytophthora rubi]
MLLPSYIFYFSDHEHEETRLKTHADFFEDEQDTPEEAVALSKRASALNHKYTVLVPGYANSMALEPVPMQGFPPESDRRNSHHPNIGSYD